MTGERFRPGVESALELGSRDPFDVLVVGGGPAGSSLAHRLGRAGYRVLVLEGRRFPRHKPCGEFMSPECLPMLEELGVAEDLRALGARAIRGMRLHGYGRSASGRYRAVGSVPAPCDHGFALRRERFDQALLERARSQRGVTVVEGLRVKDVTRAEGGRLTGVRLAFPASAAGAGPGPVTLRARFVVGADGVHSAVARSLGVQRPVPWLSKTALVTRFRTPNERDQADVHFIDGGYFVACPVDAGLVSVNLVVDTASVKASGLRAEDYFQQRLEAVPELRAALGGERVDRVRGVGGLAVRTTRQTFAGGALVGDAAGYVDPLTGEGIFFALAGARSLAAALVAALEATSSELQPESLRGYLRARRRELAPRAQLGLVLQRAMTSPALVKGFLALLEARPRLADLLVGVTGDYVPLRELARPSVWLDALGHKEPRTPAGGPERPRVSLRL